MAACRASAAGQLYHNITRPCEQGRVWENAERNLPERRKYPARYTLEIRRDGLPLLRQTIKRERGVGGTGGGQADGLHSGHGQKIALVETGGGRAVAEYGLNFRGVQDRRQVVRDGVLNAAVAGAGNVAAGDHVPQRDVMRVEHGGLFRDASGGFT